MTKILRSSDSNNAGSATITQAQFQAQITAQIDALRQLVGNADINAAGTLTNPLNSPYTLYVDPTIGSDDWEGGSYNTNSSSRIENQRLACGYSPNRPFRTLNRAVIEAAILTSKSYLSAVGDLVTIFCAPGQHTLLNGAGDASTDNITNWGTSKADTKDASWNTLLTRFNDPNWGIILPRGVTICGWDLRKTVIRPASVPAAGGTTRRRMLRVTSDCYFFGFTFKDAASVTTSHHNLAAFGFAGETALDLFYSKIRAAFPNASTSSNLDDDKAVTLTKEHQIVGEMPDPVAASADTTGGSSPYIFNCSLRSQYGLSGIDLDGSLVTGLKSLVTAQFTNVSLQKDMAAFQKYANGAWGAVADYADYIATDINDIRYKVDGGDDYRHFALRCSNGAFMQAVSIFAIGNAVHHWCESGGEITLTNSNSNFGGTASLGVGYRGEGTAGGAFTQDSGFSATHIRRARSVTTDGSNIKRIYLGTVNTLSTTQITLNAALDYQGIVVNEGYSLKEDDYIWVENTAGDDYRAQLAASPWSSGTPTAITVKNNGNNNFSGATNADGNRVYIRRLVDNRTPEEREISVLVTHSGATNLFRRPQGAYAIRLGGASTANDQLQPTTTANTYLVADSLKVTKLKTGADASLTTFKVVPISADSQRLWTASTYYRLSDVVVNAGRYYRCITAHTSGNSFDAANWVPTLSHLPVSATNGGIGAARLNLAPVLVLDGDFSNSESSTTLGWDFSTTGTASFLAQLRSTADYRAMRGLMVALGYTSNSALDAVLHPQAELERDYIINDSGSLIPGGKLGSRKNWPLEFNRPSIVRSYGLAYEWVGYQNYTKSLPKYQVTKLTDQQTIDVLAVNLYGGRCYNQGTTEEGLVVTPYTIQDLGTGRGYNTETAGLGGLSGDIDFPTTYQTLDVTSNLSVGGTLTVQGSITGTGADATTAKKGIGEIASISDITGAAQRTTDAGLNQAGARFITPEGLEYWKAQRGLLSQRTGTTTFYVVPDNAVNGGTYVFNGTSATLTADPGRSESAIAADPPTTRAKAVYLSRAVAYANSSYSSLETVNYQLAKGPYYTSIPAFNHIANIYGDTAKFPSLATLPDFTAATTPARPAGDSTATVKELVDGFEVPCFATVLTPSFTSTSARINFVAQPVGLTLNYGGTVQGVAWKSVTDTLQDESNYPNTIFNATLATLRSATKTIAEAMSDYIDAEDAITNSYQFDKFYSNHTIVVKSGSLNVWDCIFGAKASGLGSIGYGILGSIVFCTGACSVNMNGIYLWGNTIVTSLPGLGKTLSSIGTSAIYGARNSQYLIASRDSNAQARDITVTFNFRDQGNLTGASYDRDYNRNCIHVLDNYGYYALKGSANANLTSLTGSRGASFVALFGEMAPGSRIFTGGYSSYQSGYTNANKHHGIAGVFGHASVINGSGAETSTSGPKGIDGGLDPLSFYRFASYHSSLWQQARTGTLLTKGGAVTLTGGPGQQIHPAYTSSSDNVLNINSSVFVRGVDVDTAQIVGGALNATETVSGTSRSVFYG